MALCRPVAASARTFPRERSRVDGASAWRSSRSWNNVLLVQNAVPAGSLALRSLAERHDAYVEEVQRLVRAAMAVMCRRGTLDPRVSEIVAEAGLSNQAFYRHFRAKDELLLAVLDDGLRQLVTYLEHRMTKERTG